MKRNDIKRLSGAIVIAGLIAAAAVSCASAERSKAAAFRPGTYAAIAQGNSGDVEVKVTFSATRIESIEVGANGETPGLSDPAMQDIPAAIVAGQTLAVDAVSGATHSSEAVLSAVADCVAQAGGDVEALKAK